MSDRPSVLLIAEAANPEWVSVPLVGWSLADALRGVADVHLVTQIRNRDAILSAGYEEGRDFTAIDTERLAAPLHGLANMLRMGRGKGWTMVTAINALSYPYFEHLVWKRFSDDIRAGRFDIVHRVTPLTPTTVSPIAAKCARAAIPFVVGPLNGGVPWPPGFDVERRREREWLSYVRGAYKLLPGRRAMYRAASAVLAGSCHTECELPSEATGKTFRLPENAIDPRRFNRIAAEYHGGPLRACFIGRLVPYKGPDMLLAAAAPFLKDGRMTLEIVGDGPMRKSLEATARMEGLTRSVTFHGMLAHREVQDVAAGTHILTFPSIREFGGGVVLEAMALGVVPVIVDYAGPGELVDASVGYKVPVGSRTEIVSAFRVQLEAILADPGALAARSKAARARIEEHFTWAAKAGKVRAVYDWVVGATDRKPEFDPSVLR